MARKLNRNLVALSSAAIVAVWGVGFLRSEGTVNEVVAATEPATASATATEIARSVASATPRSATSTPTPRTITSYQDGVFTGSGTSRFGGFEVAVTISGGKVTDVELTRVTTRYPAARIAQLPGQVIARQSEQVDIVTGASYSSRAFRDAVGQALTKASAQSYLPGYGLVAVS